MSSPATANAAPLKIVFTTNSVRNTTVSLSDDTVYYEIVTRPWEPTLTKVNKFTSIGDAQRMVLVAEIQEIAADAADSDNKEPPKLEIKAPRRTTRVRYNGTWMDAHEFMNYSDSIGGSFKSDEGTEYDWTLHKGRLQLTKKEDGKGPLLARYHSYKRHFLFFRMSRHAWIEIKAQDLADGVMDRLIISYILIERKRRWSKSRPLSCMKIEH